MSAYWRTHVRDDVGLQHPLHHRVLDQRVAEAGVVAFFEVVDELAERDRVVTNRGDGRVAVLRVFAHDERRLFGLGLRGGYRRGGGHRPGYHGGHTRRLGCRPGLQEQQ
jgi:hypothetical protein